MKTNSNIYKKNIRTPWISSWSSSHYGMELIPQNDNGKTIRFMIKLSNSGSKLRLRFANDYSDEVVDIGSITIRINNSEIQHVRFSNKESAIFKGTILSDEIENEVFKDDIMEVRIYFNQNSLKCRSTSATSQVFSSDRSQNGNFTESDFFADYQWNDEFPSGHPSHVFANEYALAKKRIVSLLQGVDVYCPENEGEIVVFGDSIVEQGTWVNPFREEIHSISNGNASVVNAGISGNRLLGQFKVPSRSYQYFGVSGVERFERDVFEYHNDVRIVIIALGVNDIHQPMTNDFFAMDRLPDIDEMIKGYIELIKIAKERGSQVYLATITPFLGYSPTSIDEGKELLRKDLNRWILHQKHTSNVLDLNKCLGNENGYLKPEYDCGDHLHPNNIGGKECCNMIMQKFSYNKEER